MNAEKLDLIVGLLGWLIVFAISPVLGVLLALAGFAFITLWQWIAEEDRERKVMELFWNEHP